MPEGSKKEPKVIHVDKLIIKADEVIFQPEKNHPEVNRPNVTHTENRPPVPRDFWGFPLPGFTARGNNPAVSPETGEQEEKHEEKHEDK